MYSKISEKQMQKLRDILVGYFPDDLGHNADKFSAADHMAKEIIAALYSSQEPQKLIPKPRFDEVYKQCVENMDKSEPQPYCITEINRDGSITYKRIQPQSVSTSTEGMELSEKIDGLKYQPGLFDDEKMGH